MMTDVQLAGHMSGVELAHIARKLQSRYGRHRHVGQAAARKTCRMAQSSGRSRGRRLM